MNCAHKQRSLYGSFSCECPRGFCRGQGAGWRLYITFCFITIYWLVFTRGFRAYPPSSVCISCDVIVKKSYHCLSCSWRYYFYWIFGWVMADNTLYQLLGVGKNASDGEIKKVCELLNAITRNTYMLTTVFQVMPLYSTSGAMSCTSVCISVC